MPAQYPLPVFHFTVQWGGNRVGFSEVTGLTQENQPIEYRDGSFPEYSPRHPRRPASKTFATSCWTERCLRLRFGEARRSCSTAW